MLLLSRDDAYTYLNKCLVAEITATIRGIPVEVRLGKPEGLPKSCVANFDNLHTVVLSALKEHIGRLAPHRVSEVKQSLGYALDWPELDADEAGWRR